MRLSWFVVFSVLLGGCGLADYEEEMKHQQEVLARREAENVELGDPVSLVADPKDLSQGGREFQYFIRLPKGIKSTPDEKKTVLLTAAGVRTKPPQFCYTFVRDPSTTDGKACKIQEVLLLSSKWNDPTKKPTFDMPRCLDCYPASVTEYQHIVWPPSVPRKPLNFDYYSSLRKTTKAYVFKETNDNHLVIFHIDIIKDPVEEAAVMKVMQMSLETLAVDEEAKSLRQQFKKKKGSAAAPASTAPGSSSTSPSTRRQ